ncbi:3-keto-5-aminohexanoate cleavage protein [Mesorhizobium sp. WSM3224]|uniref:3-keto-5-aminohexanoate cleavage protein n=1 Tax=Mesorhizobium sp. WSM3224 TaxID=1040986 RepID=UPI00048894F7|nr:3-keto-5-aminohexanoate cleavage protein [Mesorhizobium sp. WSM3224]
MSLTNNLSPITIAVAPNGGRRTKADHPAIPLTPAELARTAAECAEAGAAMIHVHVRDRDGNHLLDADAYRQAIAAIRDAVGDRLVVQITSEALGIYSPADQMAVVRDVKPQAVSLALREIVPDSASEPAFASFMTWLHAERIFPQIILYSPEEAIGLSNLQQRGLVPWSDVPVLFVLGSYTQGQISSPSDLLPFLAQDMPRFTHWSVCAFGRNEAACVTVAALLGGHVRIGFENNLVLPNGSIAASNAELVAATAQILADCGASIASAADLAATWADAVR